MSTCRRGTAERSADSSTGVFNILVYTDLDTAVPKEWLDSDPHMINGQAEQVRGGALTSTDADSCRSSCARSALRSTRLRRWSRIDLAPSCEGHTCNS